MTILLMGAPASGKGTQAQLIAQHPNWVHISSGQLLRDEIARKTPLGLRIEKDLNAGFLAAPEDVVRLLKERVMTLQSPQKLLLDGFPRNLGQATVMEREITHIQISHIFFLSLDYQIIQERTKKRAEIEKRPDDDLEVLKNRLRVFETETLPVLEYYESKIPERIFRIDASRSIEEVHQEIMNILAQ